MLLARLITEKQNAYCSANNFLLIGNFIKANKMTDEQIKAIQFHLNSIQKILNNETSLNDNSKRYVQASNRKVQCVETGETFISIRQAARVYNILPAKICLCCKGKMKNAGGYSWKYLD